MNDNISNDVNTETYYICIACYEEFENLADFNKHWDNLKNDKMHKPMHIYRG